VCLHKVAWDCREKISICLRRIPCLTIECDVSRGTVFERLGRNREGPDLSLENARKSVFDRLRGARPNLFFLASISHLDDGVCHVMGRRLLHRLCFGIT
jgi:hypothetical protein